MSLLGSIIAKSCVALFSAIGTRRAAILAAPILLPWVTVTIIVLLPMVTVTIIIFLLPWIAVTIIFLRPWVTVILLWLFAAPLRLSVVSSIVLLLAAIEPRPIARHLAAQARRSEHRRRGLEVSSASLHAF